MKLFTVIAVTIAMTASAQNVMLMNRIGPSASDLYIANADGTGEHKLLAEGHFDYHANYSFDGKWIIFTSEKAGPGKADLYRVHPDGTGIEQLTSDKALNDQGVLSPDGTTIAYVSTRDTLRANIWLLDVKTKKSHNLTGSAQIQGDPMKPDGFFRPAWSPDGKWIAFSSDKNTEWLGHDHNEGWEHLQELGIYIVHPDGTGLKRVTQTGIYSGSPKFSLDGKEIVYSESTVETSWLARVFDISPHATTQIVSINLETGKRTELTSSPGVKLAPQYLPDGTVGYTTKSGRVSGVGYTKGSGKFPASLRSAAWSPDGKQVVYEKVDYAVRPQNQLLYSWDPKYQYRYTDVFPSFGKDGTLLLTNKDVDSSVVTENWDGSNKKLVFKSSAPCDGTQSGPCGAMDGVAFAPSFSPDAQSVVFGFGGYLQIRGKSMAKIMTARRDGTDVKDLTVGEPNAGFPSWSSDGKEVVFRTWGSGPNDMGLRIINVETKKIRVLTTALDNLPDWQPGGNRIVFTRKENNNFDIYTINSDGTDLKRLTDFPATDAHAVWSWDGKQIMWDSGQYGFKDEAELYDHSFQPYGNIWVMNEDGSNKRSVSDSHWEDSMPAYVPPFAMRKTVK